MFIEVCTDEFKRTMEKLYKVIPTILKSSDFPADHIMFTVKNETLLLKAYNRDYLYAEITLKCYNPFALNYSFIFTETQNIIKAVKNFKDITTNIEFVDGDNEVILSCEGKKIKQKVFGITDFPETPIPKIIESHEYSNTKLKERFDAVKYVVDEKHVRTDFRGIYFNNNEIVTIDGYRMAINKDPLLQINSAIIVPLKAIKAVNDMLKDEIKIDISEKYIKIIDPDGSSITCLLLEGDFYNYHKLLSDTFDIRIETQADGIISSLAYLNEFKNEYCGVHFYKNKLAIKNENSFYEAEINIDENVIMEEHEFNGVALIDTFKQCANDVVICINKRERSNLVIESNDGTNIAFVLPIKSHEKILEKKTAPVEKAS